MGCVLEESGTDEAECSRKVGSERRVAGAIRSLVNARDLQLQGSRVLNEKKNVCTVFLCMAVRQGYEGEGEI